MVARERVICLIVRDFFFNTWLFYFHELIYEFLIIFCSVDFIIYLLLFFDLVTGEKSPKANSTTNLSNKKNVKSEFESDKVNQNRNDGREKRSTTAADKKLPQAEKTPAGGKDVTW